MSPRVSSAIDWVLERLERHIVTIAEHGAMILFSMITGLVFAWALLSRLG